MEQLAAHRGQELLPAGELGGGGFGLEFLALINQRINDVGLASGLELGFEELHRFGQLRAVPGGGDDFSAVGRQLVQSAHIEVAEKGHGQGARNGRGGHHQDVGRRAVFAQFGALEHAELVLLVDHREAQPVQSGALKKQGVGAHKNPRLAVLGGALGGTLECSLGGVSGGVPLFPCSRWFLRGRRLDPLVKQRQRVLPAGAGAQSHADSQGLQQALELEIVLFGEDLCWGHQRRLIPGFHREQHGAQGHQRFARTHVAVQEPVHRPGRLQVRADLSDGPLLRPGQRERQRPVQPVHPLAGAAMRLARLRLLFSAPGGDTELESEKLEQHQVSAGPGQGLPGVGKMDLPQRLPAGRFVESGGENLRDVAGFELVKGFPEQLAKRPGGEPRSGPVDGRNPLQVHAFLGVVLDHLKLRMRDDHLGAAAFGFAIDHQADPAGHDFLHPMRVEPAANQGRAQGVRVVLLQHRVEHLLASAEPAQRDLFDRPAHADRLFVVAPGKPVKPGAILIPAREMAEQILDGLQLAAGELAPALRGQPIQIAQSRVQIHRPAP